MLLSGPLVADYLDNLAEKLSGIDFNGTLLIMQSNGGVVSPALVKKNPAITVLSGPAAAPTAGAFYSNLYNYKKCITVDMGGTSFDAAIIVDGQCVTTTECSINRYRIALPSLDIVSIGAGGGSIGWLNDGGLLQMGPKSTGAMPGPVCYDRGGLNPACTDADLVLGYLNADFFAGGMVKLDKGKAEKAIQKKIAMNLEMSVLDAAAGMYRIINNNMAQGVREITVERGYDPREFLFIVAGGAGPVHSSEICRELDIPLFLVPNVSSIFCAAGMLLGDLKHDYIRSYYAPFGKVERKRFLSLFKEMKDEGVKSLTEEEGVTADRIFFYPVLDMRYVGQYHEVQLECDWNDVMEYNLEGIFELFHKEHNRRFGYSLKEEHTPMELINIRLRVIGRTTRPMFLSDGSAAAAAAPVRKAKRKVYIPGSKKMREVQVYDGDQPNFGSTIKGPCPDREKDNNCFRRRGL